MRKFIENVTQNLFYKKSYDPDELISNINDITSSVLTRDKLLEKIAQQLTGAFHPIITGFALLDPKSKLQIAYVQGLEKAQAQLLAKDQEVTMAKEFKNSNGEILAIDELVSRFEAGEYRPVSKDLLYALHNVDIDLVVPLYVKDKLMGIIALGAKKSGDLYTQQDLGVLEIISGQTAIAIENAQLYDELREFNITLQKRVDEATQSLRVANAQLRELDRSKSEFISIASHQLRTPLTVIKGYISMMQEGSFGKIPPVIMENLTKVYTANERLIDLVENLLNISRIESGRQKFEWAAVDLGVMAKTVVEELTNNAKKKGLKLKLEMPKTLPKIYADKNKLHEVMMNFTDNAIKYSKNGIVKVSISAEPKGRVTFAVDDQGMGVNKQTLPYLFQKFSRGRGSFQVHTEGTGLGLFVARMIVEAHHGIIGLETGGPDQGSKFYFSIPLEGPKTKNYKAQEPVTKYLGK